MSVALYKKGEEFVWEGLRLAMKVVDEAEVEAHTTLGWVLHPHETIEVPEELPPEPETPAAPVAPEPETAQTVETPAAPTPAAPANPFA